MQIRMDEEQWSVDDQVRVAEVLAQISNRAHARGRLVTALSMGGRPMTDRDLVPSVLDRSVDQFGAVQAWTQSLDDVMRSADSTVRRYAAVLATDAQALVAGLRSGTTFAGGVDSWLGRLADYLELIEGKREGAPAHEALHPWVVRLLDARTAGDTVMVADLLEYEVLPRLAR